MNPWSMMVAELSSHTRQRVGLPPQEATDSSTTAEAFSAYGATSSRLPANYLLAAYSAWARACSTSVAFQRSRTEADREGG